MTRVPYTVRPITDWTPFVGAPAATGDRNLFKNGRLGDTHAKLSTELVALAASHVVLELDVRESQIRRDGALNERATPDSNAVRLAFDTPDGPMQFATDRFGWTYDATPRPYSDGWQQNLRAITLGLGALRAVDRYGITRNAEQYRGYLQIESGGRALGDTGMTVDTALQIIATEANVQVESVDVRHQELLGMFVMLARKRSHPDRNGGNPDRARAVNVAVDVLRTAGRIT